MNELLTRALTGGLFVIIVLGSFWLGGYTTFGLFLIALIIGLKEFYQMFRDEQQVSIPENTAILGGVLFFVSLCIVHLNTGIKLVETSTFLLHNYLPILLIAFVFPLELYRNKKTPIPNVATTVLGWLYLSIPFYFVVLMSFLENGKYLLTGLFVLVWMNDTFAYLTGRFLGKTKLFERISPKKTWEGTIGGVFFSLLTGFILAYYMEMSYIFFAVAAPIVAIASIFGDLFESLLKRSVKVKDSGNLLPGHGGILDRFDAVIFAIPFYYVWWQIFLLFN